LRPQEGPKGQGHDHHRQELDAGVRACAAALVVTLETSHTRAANAPVSEQVAHRFPLPSEMFTPVPLTTYMAPKFIAAQKGAAAQTPPPTRIQSCANTPNGWPYVSHACLVG
jgi:hypothetical protein